MARPSGDITGMRFHRLTVIRKLLDRASRNVFWLLACDCGRTHRAPASALRTGRVKSCGCMNQELRLARNQRHGLAARGAKKPAEYIVWQAMIGRCSNPKNKAFRYYGGRGIVVCDRWRHDFTAFLADMGQRPSPKHSIDRINNDGNYEPGNCRWATQSEQVRNSSRCRQARHADPSAAGTTEV